MTGVMSTLRLAGRPFVSVAEWYTRCAKSRPLVTAILTSGIKTSGADLFAQKVIEGRDEIDWKRQALFAAFGYGYLGIFQYWLYNVQFVKWCAPITQLVGHKGVAPVKVFLDQCIHHPFLYFPVFYSMKAGVERKPLSYAMEKYQDEIWDTCKALWSVWVPSQLVNFAFVPRHFRIPWVAMTSFVWSIILSLMQGQYDAKRNGGGAAAEPHPKMSAHFAALQVHAGVPVTTAALADKIVPPTEALTPPAISPTQPATNNFLPPAAIAAAEERKPPKAATVLEPQVTFHSFHPYSMAVRRMVNAVSR